MTVPNPETTRRSRLPWKRLGWQLVAAVLMFCAGPGILCEAGFWPLSVPGLALWAAHARRAERRAWIADWLSLALLVGLEMGWVIYVAPPMLPFVGLGLGLPLVVAGFALRRLHGLPLSCAVPAAWVGAEAFQHLLPLPFGVSWMQLGHPLIELPWIGGSARVAGIWGLSWIAAALAGLLLDVVDRLRGDGSRRAAGPSAPPARSWIAFAFGLAPLVLGALAGLCTSTGEFEPGPRLLLIQPGIPQELKNEPTEALYLLRAGLQQTDAALADGRARGKPAPDLVCWGETMFPVYVLESGLIERFEAGLPLPELSFDLTLDGYKDSRDWEQLIIGGALYDQPVPPEWAEVGHFHFGARTSFLTGAEVLFESQGVARRGNGVVLWTPPTGKRQPFALKRRLVPGAETFYGLEQFELVRDGVHKFAPFLPDMLAGERTGLLELPRLDGRTTRFSATVCFDNAFAEPYTEALVEEHKFNRGLDFHLVASNEAWYRGAYELDQMLSFSRLIAIATARPVVRVANSGVTVLFGADGAELARLWNHGKDREVDGWLDVVVPVPRDPATATLTPYVRTHAWWPWGVLLVLGLACVASRSRNRSGQPG
jgi:apolipoprotein N-acyltransferase